MKPLDVNQIFGQKKPPQTSDCLMKVRSSPQKIVDNNVIINCQCFDYYLSKIYKNNDKDYSLDVPLP